MAYHTARMMYNSYRRAYDVGDNAWGQSIHTHTHTYIYICKYVLYVDGVCLLFSFIANVLRILPGFTTYCLFVMSFLNCQDVSYQVVIEHYLCFTSREISYQADTTTTCLFFLHVMMRRILSKWRFCYLHPYT